jgi:hypothetical protein
MSRMGTSSSLKLLPSACAIAAVLALGGTVLSQESPKKEEVFSVTTRIFLQNQNIILFDISFDSAAKHTYVLGDRTNQQIDVVDTSSNTLLTPIKGGFAGATGSNATSGPDGVLIIDGDNEVWAGDGVCHQGEAHPVACEPVGPSSVKVFNLSTGVRTHVIPTGSASTPGFPGSFRADEMCLDPRDHLVMVANNADTPPYVSLIGTAGNSMPYTVVKQIAFDGTNGAPNSNNGIEQCQWSPKTGKFYISIPGIVGGINGGGAVAVIDPKTLKVVNTFKIDGNDCIAPQGMAVGPNNQILLGCNGASGDGLGSTVIINANSGAIIATLHHESGADEVWFNEGDGQYFLARSTAIGAPPQLLGVVDSVGHREDESHPTTTIANDGRNAHSVAADSIKNQVYVPIPAGVSTVCDPSNSDPTMGGNAQGCIAVYTVTKGIDDRPRTVLERPMDDHQE